ncbi:MAG: hypothetical protein M1819_005597 [Sarea resinae]|nr:MAG: hypothetical protein M1819_005597 [Sarea resinae]
MNGGDIPPPPRQRMPPHEGGRPVNDQRSASSRSNGMNKAERFEDEKRRIIASCFSKEDTDGSPLESYITHIRIHEDAGYPSTPAPPDSPPENKKPRLIIVAVRKSGRVRMHKARENANGSFSIGKTWGLEDLSCIETFAGVTPTNPEEERHKQWAGSLGFVVTIIKPYYWQAGTPKEAEFFITSLVKIYKKYTGGKLPQLIGFGPRELEALGGQPGQAARPNGTPDPPRPRAPPISTSRPPRVQQSRSPHRDLRPQASEERFSPRPGSRDQPPRFPAPESIQISRADSPQSQLRTVEPAPRPGFASSPSPTRFRRAPEKQSSESVQELSHPSGARQMPSSETGRLTPNGVMRPDLKGMAPTGRRPQTPDAVQRPPTRGAATPPSRGSNHDQPPERIRPPMAGPVHSSGQRSLGAESNDEFSTPLGSPDERAPGSRSGLRVVTDINRAGPDENVETRPIDSFPVPRNVEKLNSPATRVETPIAETASTTSVPSDRVTSTATTSTTATSTATTVPPPPEPPAEPKDEEVHRPGLGPMIKKKSNKDIANAFRKAATAYNAFRPRAGGAGERLREEKPKAEGPDGINAVVPAPSLLRGLSADSPSQSSAPDLPLKAAARSSLPAEQVPEVKVSEPTSEATKDQDKLATPQEEKPRAPSPETSRSKSPKAEEARRQKRRSGLTAKYLTSLDINPSILEGATVDIDSVLGDFGWGGEDGRTKKVETLEVDIKREIGRVEAGSWLGHLEQKDDRVETVEKLLDKAIAECDELEGLLTLYGVELSTLNDDIAFIEAQSQGLQVQTANQKLLHTELEHLLQTISISSSQLQSLRRANISTPEGLEAAEASLSLLYKAMITIEPTIRQGSDASVLPLAEQTSLGARTIGGYNGEVGSMRALREKRDGYMSESIDFLRRLKLHMEQMFRLAMGRATAEIERSRGGDLARQATKLDPRVHDVSREGLWSYSPLMLFSREMDTVGWEELMRLYVGDIKKPYQEEFRENVFAWKRATRKATSEEQEILFTSAEKEAEGLATTARKLTVKRSQTLAKTLRATQSEGTHTRVAGAKTQDGKLYTFEAFAGALKEIIPLIFEEQNFVLDFFHVSSIENVDFADAVTAAPPAARRGTNLSAKRPVDPDKSMTRLLSHLMDDMFSFWAGDLQNLVDWAIAADPLQGVGVLGSLEHQILFLEDTNQDYLIRTLQKVHDRLAGLFHRFIDEQIRAIEDTKVKIKKRKGVIAFMKTFPHFSAAVENMLSSLSELEELDIRGLVDEAYQKINKAMFESLNIIAKESPAIMAAQGIHGQGAGDPEDKEALNYHILLIENMNHYIEEVDDRDNLVLEEWKRTAGQEMNEHMGLYLDAIVRRPLGKLLDFVESTESLLLAAQSPPTIAARASHSRSTFKKLLSAYDSKELRRGIEALKKRVEKHFGDADQPSLSRDLVSKVLKECEEKYLQVGDRTRRIVDSVYEGSVELDWRRDDIAGAFRR